MILTCSAVLFDMDGTLVDSTQVVVRAWNLWASRHGIPLESVLEFSHGRPTLATMQHFRPDDDHAEALAEMARYEESEFDGIVAVPGAPDIMRVLADHQWTIVTSAWRTLAEARVLAAGLPLPRVMVPVDEIQNGKPHPEGFLRAADLLGVPPHECLVFEDTRPGIDAGLAAGMQVVGLLTTVAASQLDHRPLVRDFRDVTVRPDGERLTVHVREHASG